MINCIWVHYLAQLLCTEELNLGTVLISLGEKSYRRPLADAWLFWVPGSHHLLVWGWPSVTPFLHGWHRWKGAAHAGAWLSASERSSSFCDISKNNTGWRNWVTCDIFGSSIKLWVVEGKPLSARVESHKFNVLELSEALPVTVTEIPHLDLFQTPERGLHFQTTWGTPPQRQRQIKTSWKSHFNLAILYLLHVKYLPQEVSQSPNHFSYHVCFAFQIQKAHAEEDLVSEGWSEI